MRGVDGASPWFHLPVPKIYLIYGPRVGDVSDIKLIRTDTTLDLSQKAEKRWPAAPQGLDRFPVLQLALTVPGQSKPHRASEWLSERETEGVS